MKKHRAIPGQIHVGYLGAILAFIVVFLFFPLGIDKIENGSSHHAIPPSSEFEMISADQLADQIAATTEAIFSSFNQRDGDRYLGFFTNGAMILINGGPLVSGAEGIGEMFLQSPSGLTYDSLDIVDQRIARCGDLIIDTGLAAFNFRLESEDRVFSDPRQYLTVWKNSGEGLLNVKLIAWNALTDLTVLKKSNDPVAFERVVSAENICAATRMYIEKRETDLHQALVEKDWNEAVSFYAENALLIPPSHLPVLGRENLLAYFNSLASDETVTDIERHTVRIEGNESLVLVTNVYRWAFDTPDSGEQTTIQGKGIQIWERDGIGEWRILYDLSNPSQEDGS